MSSNASDVSQESEQELLACREEITLSQWDRDEMESLQRQVSELTANIKHLEWHCYLYRKTIDRMPRGKEILCEVKTEVMEQNRLPCSSCERDNMLDRIDELERKLNASPAKKRKYTCQM